MSWLVFYPRTLWRSVRHPLQMMERAESELKLPAPEQFRDVVSPPIFLLLTVIAANGFEVAVVGNNPLIDNGIGLAGLITDNTSLILFRLIAFASLPIISAVFALAVMRRPVDRDTLQPLFYAQCFVTTPVVLLFSIAETLTRLPQPAANIPAGLPVRRRRRLLHRGRSGLVCARGEENATLRRLLGHCGFCACPCWY